MYKIAILGCENTHANSFLRQIYKKGRHTDIEVIGIYSEEEDEGNKPMSGIADRPFAKGRNYDPNRYASNNTEE